MIANCSYLAAVALLDCLSRIFDIHEHAAEHTHCFTYTSAVHYTDILLAFIYKELCGLTSNKSAAKDQDLTLRFNFAGKYIFCCYNVCAICSRKIRCSKFRSDSYNYMIRFDLCDHLWCNSCICLDLDAKSFTFFDLPVNSCFKFLLLRSFTCKSESSACNIRCFIDCRIVSTFFQDFCSHHTCYTATDDHNVFCLLRLWQTFVLQADHRVTCTCDVCRLRIDNLIITSLCTSDTTTDLVFTAFLSFVSPFRISQLCTSDRDHVDLAVFDQLICKCRHINTANTDYRNINTLLNFSNIIHIETRCQVIRRYLVYSCKASCVTS